MLNQKIITILGTEKVGKTTLFRQMVKQYSPPEEQNSPKISPIVNYVEYLINLKNNIYKLIDTPKFQFRPPTEIAKERQKKIVELLKKSDLIL